MDEHVEDCCRYFEQLAQAMSDEAKVYARKVQGHTQCRLQSASRPLRGCRLGLPALHLRPEGPELFWQGQIGGYAGMIRIIAYVQYALLVLLLAANLLWELRDK